MLKHFPKLLSLAAIALILQWPLAVSADSSQRLLQMLDYIGVDYPPTVSDGKVVDPVEYAEMQEFSAELPRLIEQLPASAEKQSLQGLAYQIGDAVQQRRPGEQVANLTQQLKRDIIRVYAIVVAPAKVPDLSGVQALYENQCAGCHGVVGYGDGPMAQGMQPAPSDFHDLSRQRSRSVYDLYNTITLGVPETPMASFSQLSDDQRWALAFLVARFASDEQQETTGQALWQQQVLQDRFKSLSDLTGTSINEARAYAHEAGMPAQQGAAVLAYLRESPQVLEISDHAALDHAIAMLEASVEHVRNGERQAARDAALSAYLDGFELAEAGLSVVDRPLRLDIEKAMMQFREQVMAAELDSVLDTRHQLVDLLNEAKSRLSGSAFTPEAAFAGAFIILLREGVEAILVLAAIMTALIKTGRREALKYIHFGWISAVVLGIATWWVAQNLIAVSGASREITEGFAALFAAVILIYVGFWLHNASTSTRWKQYVEHKIGNAMENRTLWVLAFVSFIAVYREMFETVLFYQSMWVQLEAESHTGFITGILVALGVLLLLSFLIFRVGIRLPIKQFFQINAVLLFLLAVVFAGQGIAALQEAGTIPASLISFPRIEVLGVYPTLQSLGLQLFVLLIGAGLLLYQRKAGRG